jgi:hypothetical protein
MIALLLAAGCGGGKSGERPGAVLAAVGEADGGLSPVEELVREDGQRARREIAGAVLAQDSRIAAWGAVYAARIGLDHDREQARAALAAGTAEGDPLLAALCWRRLAADPGGAPLPVLDGPAQRSPVAAALAALAHARAGEVPPSLTHALGLPSGEPGTAARPVPADRREALLELVDPFDDGPLALAVLFAEARRERWVEGSGSARRFAAEGIRRELVLSLPGEEAPSMLERSAGGPPCEDPRYPELAEQLASPLAGRPLAVLRGAVLGASGSLRIGALRALAVAARKPEAGDLGAAAAALACDEPLVRLEAARTYLFLAARATRR